VIDEDKNEIAQPMLIFNILQDAIAIFNNLVAG
jgi:hypothetical protein